MGFTRESMQQCAEHCCSCCDTVAGLLDYTLPIVDDVRLRGQIRDRTEKLLEARRNEENYGPEYRHIWSRRPNLYRGSFLCLKCGQISGNGTFAGRNGICPASFGLHFNTEDGKVIGSAGQGNGDYYTYKLIEPLVTASPPEAHR